jgi:hypothetical protein
MASEEKNEPLETEVEQILEEARMVLPGIQALFGFQLIAVFNERFEHALGPVGQKLHLCAVVLTALAIGLIMAPAAYHLQAERGRVSRYFANYASWLITMAMAPLLLALSVEVSLVAFIVLGNTAVSSLIGSGLMLFLASLWYFFPTYRRRRQAFSSQKSPRSRT